MVPSVLSSVEADEMAGTVEKYVPGIARRRAVRWHRHGDCPRSHQLGRA